MTAHPSGLPVLLAEASLGVDLEALLATVAAGRITPGWATVELDRAARELGVMGSAAVDARDDVLGASARIVRLRTAGAAVLLEPSTEGSLAAALARHGEGWVAAYLHDAAGDAVGRVRRAGYALSAAGSGPFGEQRRVVVGRRDGPFILIVSAS